MITTSKSTCRILSDLLVAHGVKNVIISPGSRNAPLIVALSRREELTLHPVVDERSAAFIGMGMSLISGQPVALVCTSGTALLNYLPAIAEAFYRRIPLIVISADRPLEWIDQDDSQTLQQYEALSPWVKGSYDIPSSDELESTRWLATRLINDALLKAVDGYRGPVHINIRLDAPLNSTGDYRPDETRTIRMITPRQDITVGESRRIASLIASPKKVLIIAGFNSPNQKLNKALIRLSAMPNIAVMAESTANIHGPGIIHRIDTTLSAMTQREREEMSPDVVITLGGALISRHVKEFVRKCGNVEHWHVGLSHTTIDCFKHLTLRIELTPEIFFNQLASAIQPHRQPSDYGERWMEIARRGISSHDRYISRVGWSDMKAFSIFMPLIPARWNVQLSNGTAVRYYQLFNDGQIHRCDCNRGVSGIDGCTSTAIGASLAYRPEPTLLITGDMCARYDIGALGCGLVTPRLKIIVMCNGGGGIFRFIGSTRDLEEREEYFCLPAPLPLKQLADAYGFAYFEAHDEQGLHNAFKRFAAESRRPSIMAVHTPPEKSAEILTGYFTREEG